LLGCCIGSIYDFMRPDEDDSFGAAEESRVSMNFCMIGLLLTNFVAFCDT
jgi:hypothetical protein